VRDKKMTNIFDDFDVGPQSDEHYTIQDTWLDYEKTLNQQAKWASYYVDCDDGTQGDEIYIMEK
jgi:hypothetical protein